MTMTIRPRRSVLYMPGSNARAIEKARTLPADGVILDLEDAVAPDAKAEARKQVAEAVKAGGFGAREVFIRINGIDTPWYSDDLTAAAQAAPDAILVPKISHPSQLEMIGQRLLDMAHRSQDARLGDDRDAARGLQYAVDRCLRAGFGDAARRLRDGHQRSRQGDARAPRAGPRADARLADGLLAAARIYGIDILDGVYNDIGNADGFAKECEQARDMGFDGKTLIHPNQIAPCNAAFSPTADEVAQARKIIAAFDLPENKDKGVVQLDGRMVERMHADMARRTVTIAEAIEGAQA